VTEDYRRDRCVEDPLWAADEIARLEDHNSHLMNALEDARTSLPKFWLNTYPKTVERLREMMQYAAPHNRTASTILWAADEIELLRAEARLLGDISAAGRHVVREGQAVYNGVVHDMYEATVEDTCMWMSMVVNRLTNAPAFLLRPVETP